MTALHHASAEGASSIVEMLIHYGANVNDKDQHGKFMLSLCTVLTSDFILF